LPHDNFAKRTNVTLDRAEPPWRCKNSRGTSCGHRLDSAVDAFPSKYDIKDTAHLKTLGHPTLHPVSFPDAAAPLIFMSIRGISIPNL